MANLDGPGWSVLLPLWQERGVDEVEQLGQRNALGEELDDRVRLVHLRDVVHAGQNLQRLGQQRREDQAGAVGHTDVLGQVDRLKMLHVRPSYSGQ